MKRTATYGLVFIMILAGCTRRQAANPLPPTKAYGTQIVEVSGGKQIAGIGSKLSDPLVVQVNGTRLSANVQFSSRCVRCDEVKSASPFHRFVIALHSPARTVENRTVSVRFGEKARKACEQGGQETFSSSVWKRGVAELRRFLAICTAKPPDFSATQTVWRREWDTNLR